MKSPPSLGLLGRIVAALRLEVWRSILPPMFVKLDSKGEPTRGLLDVGVVPERFLGACKSKSTAVDIDVGGGLLSWAADTDDLSRRLANDKGGVEIVSETIGRCELLLIVGNVEMPFVVDLESDVWVPALPLRFRFL